MNPTIRRCAALFSAASMLLCGCSAPGSPENTDPPQTDGLHAALDISLADSLSISDDLFGLFLEDINFAVDAGLYAELIKNRSFEYGSLASGEGKHGWTVTDGSVTLQIITGTADRTYLNENNPHYAVLTNSGSSMEGIYNKGYLDGLSVSANESYTASLFVRGSAALQLSLEDGSGTVYTSAEIHADSADWHRYSVTLTPNTSVSRDLRFVVRMGMGSIQLDMVSLMPADTFAGLPIRKDLGEALQALNPSFLRFPGGCAIEGKTEESMYNWKDSIGNGIAFTVNGENAVGDAAARPQTLDLWHNNSQNPYYYTYGLGFYEYFLLCEALNCMPIPIVNAGMTCPIQSPNYTVYPIGSAQFQQCVQDALDLVEFCRGGADTKWGAVRIAMGHEEPFALRYLGIGNEQWQSEYHEHYEYFVETFEEAARQDPELFGGIELIVANGPASTSTEGWTYVKRNPDRVTTLVDEHYYESPAWFLANTHRYDSYDRSLDAKVFLGEYASQSNTMNSALAEAAFMTGLERNGDIVELACYAPLFGNALQNQWLPDMIFFSKDSLYLTPNYYVQKLFANNAGTAYLTTGLNVTGEVRSDALTGRVGLASWMTSVAYDNLKVVSAEGKTLFEDDFSDPVLFEDEYDIHRGTWVIQDGRLIQKNTGSPSDSNTGDAVYVGNTAWGDYTMTVDAEILGGDEGFLIPVCVKNAQNNIFWNVGGWGNTVSCLQIVSGGSKSGQVTGTVRSVRLQQGKTYQLTVTVSGNNIKCYIDGQLYVDYTEEVAEPLFASTVRTGQGDVIIKLVNVSGETIPTLVSIPGLEKVRTAQVSVLRADSLSAVNSFNAPENIAPKESTLEASDCFTYAAPPYSLTVIRIPAK